MLELYAKKYYQKNNKINEFYKKNILKMHALAALIETALQRITHTSQSLKNGK